MDYEITEVGKVMSPENKNWNMDITTIYVSWGQQPEGTLRQLVKDTYPGAVLLSDITGRDVTGAQEPEHSRGERENKSVQTTERIYTFPVPIPSALARESVCWGEDEIKDIT